jgi:hypothetical protein
MRDESLLSEYYPGIAIVSPGLADEVITRSGGICELCGMRFATEIHHIAGRRRKAHADNLIHLCEECHKPPHGVHGDAKLNNSVMRKYQEWCLGNGYTEEETRFLLGTKSGKLYI